MTASNDSGSPLTQSAGRAFVLSEALLISCITGLAYLCVFAYDAAYCGYFGIPLAVITISPVSLIICAALALAFGVTIGAGFLLIPTFRLGQNALNVVTGIMLLVGMALTIVVLSSPMPLWTKIAAPALTVFVAIPPQLIRMLLRRASALSSEGLMPEPVAFAVYRRFGAVVLYALPVALILLAIAFALGMSQAQHRTWYFVTTDRVPKVILAQYGDLLIAAPFDARSRLVEERFRFYEVGKGIDEIRAAQVGPLKSVAFDRY